MNTLQISTSGVRIFLKMLSVKILGSKISRSISVFLDEGSTATLINSSVVKQIRLKSTRLNVVLNSIGGLTPVTEKVDVKLKSEIAVFTLKNVLVVDDLSFPSQTIGEDISHLCMQNIGINLNPESLFPSMLIGQDHSDLIVSREIWEIIGDSLLVSRCSLGWAIRGHSGVGGERLKVPRVNAIRGICEVEQEQRDDRLERLIKFYFYLELAGIFDDQGENRRMIER